MRRILLSTAAVALMSGAAFAADIPAFEPAPILAPVPVLYDWSGFYVGLHAGYGWAEDDGIVLGGQLGFNWQFNWFVLGVEADASWAELELDDDDDIHSLASARLRAGLALNRFLPYVTGGVATADFDDIGWVAGGGADFGLTQNVSIGAEYLHYDLDDGDADVVRARLNVKFGGFGG
jgi:outer membrane immunogenic protein